MVSRSRLKSFLTGLALYTMAAAMSLFRRQRLYGKYGLNARQELDQEIIALTSELARLKRERAEGESGFRCGAPTGRRIYWTSARAFSSTMQSARSGADRQCRTDLKFQNLRNRFRKCRAFIALRHSQIWRATQSLSWRLSWDREGYPSRSGIAWPY